MNKVLHLNFFDFAISHLDFFDFWFFKFRFPFPYSMIIQYYWWIIQCNECTTTQIGAGVLGCEQGFALKFLEFDILIRIRSPSSLSSIQYYWWIAMTALRLRPAMCVPMYLFEHHLACDLVLFYFTLWILFQDLGHNSIFFFWKKSHFFWWICIHVKPTLSCWK